MFRFQYLIFIAMMSAFNFLGVEMARAEPVTNNKFCNYEGHPNSLRQTIVVIDGNIIEAESGAPLKENQEWRSFVTKFVSATDPAAALNLDAREKVTIAVNNADGSGLSALFSGCVPTFTVPEQADLESKSSGLSKFFGNDWHSEWQKQSDEFKRAALVSLVSGIKGLPEKQTNGGRFAEGGLIQSLMKSPGVSLEQGIPRFIIYTDLSLYDFPQADVETIRATARQDAQVQRLNLGRSEVHILSRAKSKSPNAGDYLSAFLLTARARLATFTSVTGSLTKSNPPVSVALYQGTIDMGESAKYPLRMRLVRDVNGTVDNSWIEMQAVQDRYVPFQGIMSCSDPQNCNYVGDNVFAQVWSDNPDPKPECPPEMPFGGLRNLSFSLQGDEISGKISDEVCFFTSRENGLDFKMTLVPNGLF